MTWFVPGGRALTVAAAIAALAVPAATPGQAAATPGRATLAAPGHATLAGAASGLAAETVPCPRDTTVLVDGPPRPSSPPFGPGHRTVGGDLLDTSGLVIAAGAPQPPAVSATSWVVADLDTGAVIGACGPHEYGTPASVQKLLLMAALLGKLDPQEVITVTSDDLQFEPGSSAMGIVEGGRYTVEMLWLGLLLVSGNDAANVLARLGGGAEGAAGGVRRMNLEAQRLGAFQTHAVTPSGLDAEGQFTSAYDLALIARACFAEPEFMRYALTREAQVPAQPELKREGFQIQNQNLLLDNYPGALGGKTGFTDLARHTYVGAAERQGRRLVVTLLGAESRPVQGWQQGAALLDWGFAQPDGVSVGTLVKPAPSSSPSATATDPGQTALLAQGGQGKPAAFAIGAAVAAACVAFFAARRRRRAR